jgi:hypothetical protein
MALVRNLRHSFSARLPRAINDSATRPVATWLPSGPPSETTFYDLPGAHRPGLNVSPSPDASPGAAGSCDGPTS